MLLLFPSLLYFARLEEPSQEPSRTVMATNTVFLLTLLANDVLAITMTANNVSLQHQPDPPPVARVAIPSVPEHFSQRQVSIYVSDTFDHTATIASAKRTS